MRWVPLMTCTTISLVQYVDVETLSARLASSCEMPEPCGGLNKLDKEHLSVMRLYYTRGIGDFFQAKFSQGVQSS